jgi:lipid-A-disaccharide synthase
MMISGEAVSSRPSVLVVAGETSGDRIAALTIRGLGRLRGAPVASYGLGGEASAAAGVELVGQASGTAVMGFGDVAGRMPSIARAALELVLRARRDPPRAALLVSFTELSTHLGRWLRKMGVRVLWCVAPQVWAWRSGRLRTLSRSLDRLAVILPFEEALWRRAGVDARYVGHPSLEAPRRPRAELRAGLGLTGGAIAVLPGSRAGEVARLAGPLCEAAALLRDRGVAESAQVLVAPSLDPAARSHAEGVASRFQMKIIATDPEHGAAPLLGAFDLALCASGTASLEAALSGVPLVVAYRLDPLSAALARLLVQTPFIALPNILLNRRAIPELFQGDATASSIARAAEGIWGSTKEAQATAEELRAILRPPSSEPFGERVAALMEGWLRAPK